jgi:hypothetical protein
MISAGAKEGSAVISVPEDVSGLLMSGDHSKFNVLENQHNLSLGHPQGDHLNPPAGLPMSSHSGETTHRKYYPSLSKGFDNYVLKGLLANCMIHHGLGVTQIADHFCAHISVTTGH